MNTWKPQLSTATTNGTATTVPRHVAVIMDGNGRWANQRQLPRLSGHHAGTENIRRVIERFGLLGVDYLTLYAFSTENWSRPDQEVQGLMGLLADIIGQEAERLHRRNVRILHLGKLDQINPDLRKGIQAALNLTQSNTGLTLSVAFNYGSRSEIVDAVRRIVREGVPAENVNESLLSSYLYTANLPDPDLIIRTAGELRLSNFLLWQAAYAEYYCTSTLWPDFDEAEVERALEAYRLRRRRFGGPPAKEG